MEVQLKFVWRSPRCRVYLCVQMVILLNRCSAASWLKSFKGHRIWTETENSLAMKRIITLLASLEVVFQAFLWSLLWSLQFWVFHFRFGRLSLSLVPLEGWNLKRMYSHWNCVAILSTSWDECIHRFGVAIFDFWLPIAPDIIHSSFIWKLNLENIWCHWSFVHIWCGAGDSRD